METLPKLPTAFVDSRGALQLLASVNDFGPIGSVVVITSHPGTQRANHRHRKDKHLCVLLTGSMEYFEKDEYGVILRWLVKADTDHAAVFTPPEVDHCMRFTEQTTFITIADRHRTQQDYEEDLIRCPSLADEFDRQQADSVEDSDPRKPRVGTRYDIAGPKK